MNYLNGLPGLAIISIFVLILLRLVQQLRSGEKGLRHPLPPGPYPLPIVGNIFELGQNPPQTLAKLSKAYGPIMRLKLGSRTTIVISSSELAKQVLGNQALNSRPTPDALRAMDHHKFSMLSIPMSDHWRKVRRLLNNVMFTSHKLRSNESLREKKVLELIAHVREFCEAGRAVDIGSAAFTTALNMISNTLFSMDMATHRSHMSLEFKDIVQGLTAEAGKPNPADFFPLLRFIDPIGARRKTFSYYKKMFKIFDAIIKERLRSPSEKGDLLDVLLSKDGGSSSCNMDDVELFHFLVDMFVAGTDTTMTTVEWTMAELMRRPKAMARAQAELRGVLGEDSVVRESDIARLPYLQAVSKEALRLHPPTPFLLPHKADSDQEIGGVTVPKDAQILINLRAIGKDPSTWTDPDEFLPERFLKSKIDYKGRDFELIPFGSGKRMCPGMPLATRMVQLMVASLIHSFDWKLEDGKQPETLDMREDCGLVLKKLEPLRAIPTVK